MPDYVLAIGDHAPYGFTSADDAEAVRHAAAYAAQRHADTLAAEPDAGLTLAGPNGPLTGPAEGLRTFCGRVSPGSAATNDVQPGDPVTPDCNEG